LIFVLITKTISVLLGLFPALLDILPLPAVLPFGLSSACFCFTKLMRPLVKHWRFMEHTSFIYLNDGFGSQPNTACSARRTSLIQRKELSSSGFLCNEEKSHWTPMHIGDWLGFVIDTISLSFWPNSREESLQT